MRRSVWVRAAAFAAALTLLLTGCVHRAPDRNPTPEAKASPPVCPQDLGPPLGFVVTQRSEVPQGDHVGVRIGMRDEKGRKLFYEAGIAGEFAEGATPRGDVTLLDGEEAHLYGAGSVWILTWDQGGVCGSRAIIANDISKRVFVVKMMSVGLMQPGD